MRIDALAQEAAGTGGGPIDMGDAVVFDEIYRSYFPPLCLFAENYVPEKDAEDVIENLFLKLWKKRYQFRDTQHVQAFLYHATRNACLDFIKTAERARKRCESAGFRTGISESGFLHEMIRVEVLAELYRAINNLPSQCGKVIHMSYIQGLSNAEIALELGLSVQTVKNHKGRGLALLKDALPKYPAFLLLFLNF